MPLMASADLSDSTQMSNVVEIKKGPDWKMLSQLYAEGASDVEIAKELGITISQFLEMERDHPEFATFVAKGRTLSQAWWVYQARNNLWNKDFNTTLFNFNMKNRFGWADKIETNSTGDDSTKSADTLKAELAKAAKRLGSKYPELFRQLGEEQSDGS